ncbi:hypothetical protein K3495_g10847 [Podosphaera aphanis]|nr:hypothetical protein K3495_g10847 [Podosphaera aphanis]
MVMIFLEINNDYKSGRKTIYIRDRGGKKRDGKNPDLHPSKRRKDTGSRKKERPFKVQAHQLPNGEWRGSIKEVKEVQKDLHKYHNHEASDGPINHPTFRTAGTRIIPMPTIT